MLKLLHKTYAFTSETIARMLCTTTQPETVRRRCSQEHGYHDSQTPLLWFSSLGLIPQTIHMYVYGLRLMLEVCAKPNTRSIEMRSIHHRYSDTHFSQADVCRKSAAVQPSKSTDGSCARDLSVCPSQNNSRSLKLGNHGAFVILKNGNLTVWLRFPI